MFFISYIFLIIYIKKKIYKIFLSKKKPGFFKLILKYEKLIFVLKKLKNE